MREEDDGFDIGSTKTIPSPIGFVLQNGDIGGIDDLMIHMNNIVYRCVGAVCIVVGVAQYC